MEATLAMHRSVPVLELRPQLGQRRLQAAADVDRPVLLGHAPRMEVASRLLDRRAALLEPLARALQHDHHLTGRALGSPEEVRLVPADRARQAVARAPEVDRPGLAVVAGEDGGLRALLGWQRGEDVRHLL